ncbi:MAG TPA: alternative ribosome rescue aminoacyl-tRNA hydrolase ArfB [Myxococcota bacterium]|nr:alternative ribosome rescue aminoacyl-tRNA hydrolase ArfB [Myxococcota bacterium]
MAETRDLLLPDGRRIPARALELRASRASGPGGQTVTKVETRIELCLDLGETARALGTEDAMRIAIRLVTRLDAAGRVRVASRETRSRARNAELAHERLEALVAGALAKPRPRHATRPTRASRERRLGEKRVRAARKQRRGRVRREED